MHQVEDALRDALRVALDAVEEASPVDAVSALTHDVGAALGATSVSFLVADLSGRALVRLTRSAFGVDAPGSRQQDEEVATTLPLDGGPADRALSTQAVQVLPPVDDEHAEQQAPGWTVLAPVTERGEAIGLLELTLPAEPPPDVVRELARLAHLLGFVVVASGRHTDLYEWGQRSTPFSLSAEIQRRLLPPAFTCETDSFTLSAWLEPTSQVGGDTFDYSVARDVLRLSITDAMGHGVASALTATLCVGSLRNARRHSLPLLEQAANANEAMCAHAESVSSEAFATGLLGCIDLRTSVLSVVNAGHVSPYLIRSGEARRLDLPADLPFGMFAGATYTSTDVALEPGDRLVLVTDGMLERGATRLDLLASLSTTRDLHPREATRAVIDLLLAVTGSNLLDDAALMIVDWHGPHGRVDRTTSGVSEAGPRG